MDKSPMDSRAPTASLIKTPAPKDKGSRISTIRQGQWGNRGVNQAAATGVAPSWDACTLCLSLAIALPGLRFLGQTLAQFMMVLQRYSLYWSSIWAMRSLVDWSLESSTQRYAYSSTAGPKYLSEFHQYEGQAVEQQAQRMHSYSPSSCARSASD